MKDLLLRARAVVRTSNMKISRRHLADYVKTLHQKACCTCSTIIFLHSTNQIFDLWRCRRQILNSLLRSTERTLFMWLLISAGFTMSRGDWSRIPGHFRLWLPSWIDSLGLDPMLISI